MKRISASPGQENGFTLIELLAVITIILLLAGLILSIAGNAQYKAAQSRAQSEIQALSSSLGNYQIDNGTFPRDTSSAKVTDTLDARNTSTYSDPAGPSMPAYKDTSKFLYQNLCGAFYNNAGTMTIYDQAAATNNVPKPTTYFPFKNNQLSYNGGTITGNPLDVIAIADPFGFSYAYSTAYQADVDNQVSPPARGYNPTFDMWSTAGYSPTQGKSLPANTTTANVVNLWIKNW